jgi:hypothetical protein
MLLPSCNCLHVAAFIQIEPTDGKSGTRLCESQSVSVDANRK